MRGRASKPGLERHAPPPRCGLPVCSVVLCPCRCPNPPRQYRRAAAVIRRGRRSATPAWVTAPERRPLHWPAASGGGGGGGGDRRGRDGIVGGGRRRARGRGGRTGGTRPALGWTSRS